MHLVFTSFYHLLVIHYPLHVDIQRISLICGRWKTKWFDGDCVCIVQFTDLFLILPSLANLQPSSRDFYTWIDGIGRQEIYGDLFHPLRVFGKTSIAPNVWPCYGARSKKKTTARTWQAPEMPPSVHFFVATLLWQMKSNQREILDPVNKPAGRATVARLATIQENPIAALNRKETERKRPTRRGDTYEEEGDRKRVSICVHLAPQVGRVAGRFEFSLPFLFRLSNVLAPPFCPSAVQPKRKRLADPTQTWCDA